jgi:hypothetical protein
MASVDSLMWTSNSAICACSELICVALIYIYIYLYIYIYMYVYIYVYIYIYILLASYFLLRRCPTIGSCSFVVTLYDVVGHIKII